MSKKDNKHYRPRHTRSDEDAVRAEKRPQTSKRSLNEKQLQTGSETAKDLFPERIPEIPQKKSVIAQRVNLNLIEEQPKSIRKSAADTPEMSPEITESPEVSESSVAAESLAAADSFGVAEKPDVAESSDVAENSEKVESLENTENSKDTEGVEDTVSEQKEESSDPAASVSSDEETADKAQSGEAESVSKTTHNLDEGEDNGGEEDALVVSVLPAEEVSSEELAELYGEPSDSSQESEEQPRKKKKWKRILIAVVSILLAIIIALVGTFFVMREVGRRNIHTDKKFEVTLPTESGSNEVMLGDKYGRIINYNGVSYMYNNDIIALTFIGVDDGHGPDKGLKMADAIYVLAINSKNGKVKLLNISRDIITDVNVYSQEGAIIDTERIQIAYSNAYSEKGSTGGHNTNRSVSRLMFGLPMENYFEINLDAVSTLNDAVGGVRVTSALTFTSPEDGRTINEGDDVTLHGKEAEYYVRRRDITELESNNDRMQRQQEYIMSFLGSILPEAKKNPGMISDLYSAIKENSETSLSATELVYIASSAVENIHSLSDIEIIKFDGEIVAGINAEMHVSDNEVLSKMLDIFYEPLNTSATEASESTDTSNSAAAAQAAASQTTTATAAE